MGNETALMFLRTGDSWLVSDSSHRFNCSARLNSADMLKTAHTRAQNVCVKCAVTMKVERQLASRARGSAAGARDYVLLGTAVVRRRPKILAAITLGIILRAYTRQFCTYPRTAARLGHTAIWSLDASPSVFHGSDGELSGYIGQ